MSLEWEGVVTVQAILTDYADNTSFTWVRYKIDKTGPQIAITGMTESSDYAFYQANVPTSLTVIKNDSADNTSTVDRFPNPTISEYQWTPLLQVSRHTRSALPTIYFQNTTTGTGANTAFNIGLNTSDSYNGYLTATAAWGGYSGPLISDLLRMELRDEAGTAPMDTVPFSGDLTTARLINNNVNGQSKYRLRLYDKSVSSNNWSLESGNYSETAFYAVRDNTPPNMGGNGWESTLVGAYERLLQFPGNVPVYDATAYINGYRPEANGVSRMFGASDSMSLTYRLNDTGITGNGVNTVWTTASQFELYNAGIDTNITELKIEKADDPGVLETFVSYTNRYENTDKKDKNFSRVDNDPVSNGTYRKYSTSYQTSGINKLCDAVGNCLTPALDFRVTAASLDKNISNSTLATDTASDGKILANGTDKYTFRYQLRDVYGNKIVPVVSQENNNTPFKTVTSTLYLHNGLYTNQLSSNPTGERLAIARDLETDNIPVDVTTVNTTAQISAREGGSNPNGNYGYSFASGVPSSGSYPYLTGSTKLEIASIVNEAVVEPSIPVGATYPETGARIGSFVPDTTAGGNSNPMVTVFGGDVTQLVAERWGAMDIGVSDNYGKIVLNPGSGNVKFTDISARRVNFEFASPYVYGLIGRQVLVDGKYSNHFKKLYLPRSGTTLPYNVYEKDIVTYYTGGKDEQPGILNFTLRDADGSNESLTNSGIRLLDTPPITFSNTSSSGAFAFIRDAGLKNMPLANFSGSGREVSLQMSSISTFGSYDNTRLRVGLVSALAYKVWENIIQLPSVGRGMVRPGSSNALNQYDMSRKYFDDEYQIGDAKDIVNPMNSAALTDIAITGLTNQYNGITTDTGATQANTAVEAEISRSTFVTTVKKNVATLTAGFNAVAPKNWCSLLTINQVILNWNDPSIAGCTVESNGEKITFIDGNSVLDCGPSGICSIDSRRSLVVRGGSLLVRSNISTRDTSGAQTDGQLVLVSMATDGLSDVTIPATGDIDRTNSKAGWIFIDTEVTNIDAFLIAQGPMVSFAHTEPVWNTSKIYGMGNTLETELVNQLHINGSILALNTIGGWRDKVNENYVCPYIVTNCDQNAAQYFDLIFLRRFKTIGRSYFTNQASDNSILVPFYPDRNLPNWALRSGWFTGTNGTSSNELDPPQSLRHITDSAYQNFPMLIERDTRWNNSPSRLFLSGN
jgi:hypothetical protein